MTLVTDGDLVAIFFASGVEVERKALASKVLVRKALHRHIVIAVVVVVAVVGV